MNNIDDILDRRVAKILPSKNDLETLLKSGKKLRLYQGFDPTGFRLHLGHTVGLRKLMDFANAGHEVIFLFGTGTVLVGDPSERDTGRKLISPEEIERNIRDWKRQVSPFVDFSKVTIKQNGDWLTKLTLKEFVSIASNISATQLFKRESFTRRLEVGDTVWYHETMYPLLQGYDSVVMDVDLEVGGTDQEFNMLVGRELMKKMLGKDKLVLTTPMILGTDSQQMSKSSNNCIWLDDQPEDIFGKIMSLPDDQIISYLQNVTNLPQDQVDQIKLELKQKRLEPLAAKKTLAHQVVFELTDSSSAKNALSHFESTIQQGQLPKNIPECPLDDASLTLLELCRQARVESSSAQIKRTIKAGGVQLNGQKLLDPNITLQLKNGDILKFGKREFLKLKLSH